MTADRLAADRMNNFRFIVADIQTGRSLLGDDFLQFNCVLISYWAPHAVHPADAAETSVTRGVA